jgi:hypothetical protein
MTFTVSGSSHFTSVPHQRPRPFIAWTVSAMIVFSLIWGAIYGLVLR